MLMVDWSATGYMSTSVDELKVRWGRLEHLQYWGPLGVYWGSSISHTLATVSLCQELGSNKGIQIFCWFEFTTLNRANKSRQTYWSCRIESITWSVDKSCIDGRVLMWTDTRYSQCAILRRCYHMDYPFILQSENTRDELHHWKQINDNCVQEL